MNIISNSYDFPPLITVLTYRFNFLKNLMRFKELSPYLTSL